MTNNTPTPPKPKHARFKTIRGKLYFYTHWERVDGYATQIFVPFDELDSLEMENACCIARCAWIDEYSRLIGIASGKTFNKTMKKADNASLISEQWFNYLKPGKENKS